MRLTYKYLPAILVAALLLCPTTADAVKIKGRAALQYFNNDDDASEQDYSFIGTRLKLDAEDFYGEKTFFHFNGSSRNADRKDYNTDIPEVRIDYANLELRNALDATDVSLGRQYLDHIAGTRVDGLDVQYHLGKEYGIGAFGGLEPEPYKDRFDGDYAVYGGYGFLRQAQRGLSAGYVYKTFKGSEDSSYMQGNGYYYPMSELRFFATARGDRKIGAGSGYELTNLMLNANYRIERKGRVTLTYNQYRAIKLYQSMNYSINHDLQKVLRLYADYKITNTTKLHGSYDYRQRDSDSKNAYLWTAGVKESDLLDSHLYLNASYRGIHYFTMDAYQIFGAIGAEPREDLVVEANVAFMRNEQDGVSNTMEQYIYGVLVDWYARNDIFVTGSVEFSQEKYLSIDSVYTARASNDYRATTFFLQAGYRF